MNKTRIIYINDSSYIGGAENSLHLLVQHSHLRGFQISLLLPKKGKFSERLSEDNTEVHYLNFREQHFEKPSLISYTIYTLKLVRLLKKNKIDLIHTNSLRSSIDTALAARLANIPVIGHIRDIRHLKRASCYFLNKLDQIIAVSDATRYHFINEGIDEKRIVTIHNGIDLKLFDSSINGTLFRKQFDIKNRNPLVAIIGQVCERKGHEYFLQAAKQIHKKMPNTNFLVVGDDLLNNGKYRLEMENMAEQFGIHHKTIFTGFIGEMPGVLAAVDILVLASLQDPFPRVILEGMAMAKAIVATDVGGVTEALINEETGFIVPPANANVLAEKILILLENNDLAQKMGVKARKRVERNFSIQNSMNKVISIYNKILV
tara:strand:- start:1958 stop:3082 length:1125 start_codon:yes stop_codon:yes gene_type:complete